MKLLKHYEEAGEGEGAVGEAQTSTSTSEDASAGGRGGGDVTPPTPEERWITLEDDFVFVLPIYISHLGSDIFAMPGAKLEEPVIYLYCLRYGVVSCAAVNICYVGETVGLNGKLSV